MSCFILHYMPPLSARQSPRLRPTATAVNTHHSPQQPVRSYSVSTVYLPPSLPSSRLAPASGDSPPRAPSSNRRRRDDDDGSPSFHSALLAYIVNALRQYSALLESAPLATKSLSACFLVFLSDFIAQALNDAPPDFPSFIRYALYGLFIAGPQGHYWYQTLEHMVTFQGPTGVLVKVICDQLLYAPPTTALFFFIMKTTDGESLRKATDFVRANFLPTMFLAWRVWPFVSIVNFAFVPAGLRVVFTSGVSVFWVAYLSVLSSKKQVQDETCTSAL